MSRHIFTTNKQTITAMQNMNGTLETLYGHVSVREYEGRKVEEGTLDRILKAACSGSTMGNMQLFSIIVTEDEAMKQQLAPYHFNQPMATEAPLMLTFCADFHRFDRYCEFRDAGTDSYGNLQGYQWAVTDALIAAQNACVAAEACGLGLCWLGTITYNVKDFIRILKLPKHVIPVACITMGYPKQKPSLTRKLPVQTMVHREVYRDYDRESIDEAYRGIENSEETARLLEENGQPNLAQIFTKKRYVKKDNEFFSTVLAEALKEQGF